MLTIACVKQGPAYTSLWVNILFDMVTRNLSAGMAGRFVCLTDDAEGLGPGVEVIPLSGTTRGWFSKLELFRPGIFPAGDRILYLDLDTVITGDLDAIAAYDGPFGILRDFYRPDGTQSCVMAWEAGTADRIWTKWISVGRPEPAGGDQEWIESVFRPAWLEPGYQALDGHYAILQDKFPGQIVSYKVHCATGLPRDAVICNFHGDPKPDCAPDEWVQQIWKIGGGRATDLKLCFNTSASEIAANIRHNSRRDLPWLDMAPAHDRHVAIVGGGPSAADLLDEIRKRRVNGQDIWALNGAAKWLDANRVPVDVHVLLDAREDNLRFVTPPVANAYMVASQTHQSILDALAGRPTTLWHAHVDALEANLPANGGKPRVLVACGSTVGLAAMGIAYAQGYRKIHLYGYDSSLIDDDHHAYAQSLNDGERVLEATVKGRTFKTTPWMAAQAREFQIVAAELANGGAEITVHGDGLLPHVARSMMQVTVDGRFKQVNGLWFPKDDEHLVAFTIDELPQIDQVLAHVPGNRRRVCLQAGGNVGVWPLHLARSFQSVLTFEPEPDNWECLLRNTKEVENLKPHFAALGATQGLIGITRVPNNAGAHFVSEGDEVQQIRIDDLALPVCDLIWLDIEGAESAALKGAVETIKRCRPLIAIEDKGLSERYGVGKGDVPKWLEDAFGYQIVGTMGRDVMLRPSH